MVEIHLLLDGVQQEFQHSVCNVMSYTDDVNYQYSFYNMLFVITISQHYSYANDCHL